MVHCSVLILHQSWHTPRMGTYTMCVLVSGLLCHWRCYDCQEHIPPNRERQDAGLAAEKKRKGHLTAPDQAQYSFHKTSAHSSEHNSNSQCPSLLFTHKKKALLSGGPLGKEEVKVAPPGGWFASKSLQLCSLVFSCVRETGLSFRKGKTLYWGKNLCQFLKVKENK